MTARQIPSGARQLYGLPATGHARQIIQLPDGSFVRVDDRGHLDRIYFGGVPHPGIAADPDARKVRP